MARVCAQFLLLGLLFRTKISIKNISWADVSCGVHGCSQWRPQCMAVVCACDACVQDYFDDDFDEFEEFGDEFEQYEQRVAAMRKDISDLLEQFSLIQVCDVHAACQEFGQSMI